MKLRNIINFIFYYLFTIKLKNVNAEFATTAIVIL